MLMPYTIDTHPHHFFLFDAHDSLTSWPPELERRDLDRKLDSTLMSKPRVEFNLALFPFLYFRA